MRETITNTFSKMVSAFSNYDGGEIYFGINDEGNIKGLPCKDQELSFKVLHRKRKER